MILILVLLNLCFQAHAATTSETTRFEIAITIDDLPTGHDAIWTHDQSPTTIEKTMLQTFHKHHLTGIYTFVVGGDVNTPEYYQVINRWVEAGQKLANHTFKHPPLSSTSAADYIAGIEQNDLYLQQNWHIGDNRFFRYPYLEEGDTLEKRNGVRQYLMRNNYKIAQVTVDFADPKLNAKYVNALLKGDQKSAEFQRKEFLRKSVGHLYESVATAKKYFNRDIRHILLLHLTQLTAEMLDQMLTAYEEIGARFISLDEALADSAYATDPQMLPQKGLTFLEQLNLKYTGNKDWPLPSTVPHPR